MESKDIRSKVSAHRQSYIFSNLYMEMRCVL